MNILGFLAIFATLLISNQYFYYLGRKDGIKRGKASERREFAKMSIREIEARRALSEYRGENNV